jgi:catechol 2,3-dioxygenase-like lactoylglutathione lyase family enzyme
MLTHIHFQPLIVTDIERARDFYRDKLGLGVERDVPYGDDRWVFMRVNGSATLLHFDKRDAVPKSDTPALILATEDVDRTCDELRGKGVTIRQGPADAPWAPGTRWAMIDDSEGNLVLIQTIGAT